VSRAIVPISVLNTFSWEGKCKEASVHDCIECSVGASTRWTPVRGAVGNISLAWRCSLFLFTLIITGALVSSIPLLIGCGVLQRFWRGGLGTGSVKG
jgi:hypothetical protein